MFKIESLIFEFLISIIYYYYIRCNILDIALDLNPIERIACFTCYFILTMGYSIYFGLRSMALNVSQQNKKTESPYMCYFFYGSISSESVPLTYSRKEKYQ